MFRRVIRNSLRHYVYEEIEEPGDPVEVLKAGYKDSQRRDPHTGEWIGEGIPFSRAKSVSKAVWNDAFQKARRDDPEIAAFTTDFSEDDLKKMTFFLTPDGKTGGALKREKGKPTEAVGLFNNGGEPGAGGKILELLKSKGATRLDAFGEFLRKLYERHGFSVTETIPWNDEYKPPAWDVEERGRPNVYVMDT